MNQIETQWPVFVVICLGWAAFAYVFLAGRKVYFEPYREKDAQ